MVPKVSLKLVVLEEDILCNCPICVQGDSDLESRWYWIARNVNLRDQMIIIRGEFACERWAKVQICSLVGKKCLLSRQRVWSWKSGRGETAFVGNHVGQLNNKYSNKRQLGVKSNYKLPSDISRAIIMTLPLRFIVSGSIHHFKSINHPITLAHKNPIFFNGSHLYNKEKGEDSAVLPCILSRRGVWILSAGAAGRVKNSRSVVLVFCLGSRRGKVRGRTAKGKTSHK
jgi:hypothetical protein